MGDSNQGRSVPSWPHNHEGQFTQVLTLENIFDDGVIVGILPPGADDLEDVQQCPSGVGLVPGAVGVLHLDDALAGVRRTVDEHVEVRDA